MPVPKNRVSHSRKRKRSANKRIVMGQITQCQTCQAPLANHTLCQFCGHYKGIKRVVSRMDRIEGRIAARQATAATHAVDSISASDDSASE